MRKTIGPEEARGYLEKMEPPSYPVDPGYVHMLAERMRRGEWVLEGERLLEDEEGVMIQGRRRMHAVVEAGVEVEFEVGRVTGYRVARIGQAAWATGLTREEAERECELANRTCAPGHHVYPEEGER